MSSVLLVSGHIVVRRGLRQLLSDEFRVGLFGEAATARQAFAELKRAEWDVLIIGLDLPGVACPSLLAEIRAAYPNAKLLAYSAHPSDQAAHQARRLGADGHIDQDVTRTELIRAFQTVLAGKQHFAPGPVPPASQSRRTLSKREHTVLLGLASGQQLTGIASSLRLNVKTVSTYKHRLLQKLELRSTADLVRYAIEHGLLERQGGPK